MLDVEDAGVKASETSDTLLNLGARIYPYYEKHLTDNNKIDFDKDEFLREGQIYNKWFEYFQLFDERSKYVYLQTDYNICYERVGKRKRNGESEIPISYLKDNNSYHDNWLMNEKSDKVLILDGFCE